MTSRKPAIPREIHARWNRTYEETVYHQLPWFSPVAYPWIAETVREGVWRRGARLLDVGCGAGTNALHLARHGFRVSGIDLAEGAIRAARTRAMRAHLTVDFRTGDVLQLPYPDGRFGGALDIGCFHTLPPRLRRAYSRELARVVRPGGTVALSWIGRESTSEQGPPHRPSLEEATRALEEEFVFLRTEFRDGAAGRPGRGRSPVYCALLGRRSTPRPPER
jgi:2-polyprenyl-3-methyl-5-hydroxy-6-metoxy-1,4-benzoquinol methylase